MNRTYFGVLAALIGGLLLPAAALAHPAIGSSCQYPYTVQVDQNGKATGRTEIVDIDPANTATSVLLNSSSATLCDAVFSLSDGTTVTRAAADQIEFNAPENTTITSYVVTGAEVDATSPVGTSCASPALASYDGTTLSADSSVFNIATAGSGSALTEMHVHPQAGYLICSGEWDAVPEGPQATHDTSGVDVEPAAGVTISDFSFTAEQLPVPLTDLTSPSTPGDLAGKGIDGEVELTWEASTDNVAVDHYIVYRDGVDVGHPTAASFADAGLANGTAHEYAVQAEDPTGNLSAVSASITLTPHVPTCQELNNCPPPDQDGDGVPDAEDHCPTEPGPAANHGCPEPPPPAKEKETGGKTEGSTSEKTGNTGSGGSTGTDTKGGTSGANGSKSEGNSGAAGKPSNQKPPAALRVQIKPRIRSSIPRRLLYKNGLTGIVRVTHCARCTTQVRLVAGHQTLAAMNTKLLAFRFTMHVGRPPAWAKSIRAVIEVIIGANPGTTPRVSRTVRLT